MYQTPDLSDFERNLRKIIADGEKEAHADRLRISTAMITGANLGGSRVTIAIIKEFDRIHDRTLELAMHLIRDFAQRSELTIMALIDTARPLLDNFAEKLFNPSYG